MAHVYAENNGKHTRKNPALRHPPRNSKCQHYVFLCILYLLSAVSAFSFILLEVLLRQSTYFRVHGT